MSLSWLFLLRREVSRRIEEGEETGHAGEHVEDDNGGTSYAVGEAPKEIRHV